jgi:LuxR family maltose regulon positive regulatory protein
MGLRLTAQDGLSLAERTEGWVAGLQLAALALQAQPGHTAGAVLAAGHRYVADFLLREVVARQPEEVQRFLRQVSVLERMTGPLCAAVTGRAESAGWLEQMARANLFLARLERDSHGEWYRFHQLFREYLVAQLHRAEPEAEASLHRRASAWYEQQGLTAEAVDHALAGGDASAAVRLVAAAAPALQQRGEFSTLRYWLDRLPEEAVWANPRLCIARAWLLLDSSRSQQAAAYLDRFDAFLAALPPQSESNSLRGEMAALRAVFAAMRLEPEQALAFARQAEQQAPAGDAFVQPYVAFSLGAAYKMAFDSMRAEQSLRHAGALAAAAGHTYLAYSAFGNLADVQHNTGRLPDAIQSNRRALSFVEVEGGVPPWAGWIYWAQSRLAYEQNALPAAEAAAECAVDLCAQWGNAAMGARAQQVRVQLALAVRRYEVARARLDDADHLARQSGEARLMAAVTRLRVTLALAQRDLEQARQWAATLPPVEGDRFPYHHFICLARLELAAGQPARALEHLAAAWRSLEATDLVSVRLQVLVLEAVARRARGQSQQAQAVLERALAMGQPGGFLRTFVDEGLPIQELLRRSASAGAASRGPLAEYAQQLLAAFAAPAANGASPALRLTARELQILRLLAAGLSNREIAAHLVVAPATLKRHVSNLYLKLEVHSRTQALARAAELGLF